MKPFALTLIILTFSIQTISQITFEKTYGFIDDDFGYCVQPTSDGGFIVCGTTSNVNTTYPQIFIIKTDAFGDTVWTKILGNPSYYSYAYSVIETFSGDYIVAGSLGSIAGSSCSIIKLYS